MTESPASLSSSICDSIDYNVQISKTPTPQNTEMDDDDYYYVSS